MYRSGRALVVRQLVGALIRLAAMVAVTRLIGQESYGVFAAVAALAAVLSTAATFGADVHLTRVEQVDEATERSVLSLLVAASVVLGALAVATSPWYGRWLGAPEAVGPLRVAALLVPLGVLAVPARARLERGLDLRRLARAELGGDLIVPAVAIPLALAGAGVWAPLAGLLARSTWLAVATAVIARYRPRLGWDPDRLRAAGRFGATYSAGRWMTMASNLVNPVIVGGLAGPAGVASVAVASRAIEQLGAVKQAVVRLATPTLARFRHQPERLAAAHTEAMLVQIVGSVPLYAGLAFTGPWLVPQVLGSEWTATAEVLALLAVAASIGTVFNLYAPTLFVIDRAADVARLRLLQFAVLAGATLAAVPAVGVVGYGLARVLRCLPFGYAHRRLPRPMRPDHGSALRWLLWLLPPMASPWLAAGLRPVLLVPALVALLDRRTRDELAFVLTRLRRGVGGSSPPIGS